jgi:polygalacturonase
VESQYDVSNGTANDSPAINAAFQACGNGGVVAFAEGVDYNVYTPISATNLSDIEIQMFGNLHLPQNITYIQALYNETAGEQGNLYSLYWFRFSGPRIRYLGTPNVTTGWIKSYGQAWWDANPTNETGLDGRPHLMLLNTTDGSAQHLKSSKPIAWQFRLVGRNITVQNTVIESYSESGGFLYGKGFPFNTDGIQVAGTDITITDSLIYNGDDAFAIQSGAHNVTIQRATIGYASHGLSIGSLGQNQASFANVSNIVFDDITCVDTVYCARFKSWRGGQGLARNLTWQNIRAYNVTFPIFVTQTYFNQGSGQTQIENGAVVERPNNSSVLMENFTWTNWTGTIASYQRGDGSCVSDVYIYLSLSLSLPIHTPLPPSVPRAGGRPGRENVANESHSPAGTTSDSPTCSTTK